MKLKPILIVSAEPNSIFLEIFFKALKKKIKSPIILIASKNLVESQMQKLKFKKKIQLINYEKLNKTNLNNKFINLINLDYKQNKPFKKISKNLKNILMNLLI